MNITYIIGVVAAILVFLLGCVLGINLPPEAGQEVVTFTPGNLWNFFDAASIFIVIGCTFAIVVASFPGDTLGAIPKHFGVILNTGKFDPMKYIDQLVDLAQTARKNGLLSLEEKANEQSDPFFKQAIMLIVDANDPDKVRAILENDIDCMSARHEDAASMYDKASSIAPAFGMVGTLVGLINMLANMSLDGGGSSSIGQDMGTALITTLYGSVLANWLCTPVAGKLKAQNAQEMQLKEIMVEGLLSIQAGENPRVIEEKLKSFLAPKERTTEGGEEAGGEE